MRFEDSELERRYEEQSAVEARGFARVALFLGCVLGAAFGALDLDFAGDEAGPATFALTGAAVATMAASYAVAGVIGQHKFAYDLWGDTVNTASRMESHGIPGRIQVSEPTRLELGERYVFGPPMRVDVKGKGLMTTYELQGPLAPTDDL